MLRNREEDYHFMNDDDSNEDEEMIHHDIQMAAQGMEWHSIVCISGWTPR